jgi:hypothetical protein
MILKLTLSSGYCGSFVFKNYFGTDFFLTTYVLRRRLLGLR